MPATAAGTHVIGMILAAGRGERMRPLSDHRPKALLEVGGVSLVERQLQRLQAAGAEVVVINLGWLGEQIVERIGDGSGCGVQVVYSPEYDRILETGGGIRRALPVLGDEPFWVLNGDVFTDLPLPPVDLADDCLAHLILVPKPAYKPAGDFALQDGLVRRASAPSLTFSGMAVYRPAMFAGQPPGRFPLAPLLFAAADRGQLEGQIYHGVWEDVGTAERLEDLNRRYGGRDA